MLFGLLIAVASAVSTSAYGGTCVGVPLFHFRDGSTFIVGKAFAVRWFGNRNILICPLHLLGPAGGYPTYVDPHSVPDLIESVDVMDLQKREVLTTAHRGLLRTGSPVEHRSGNLSDDMMAFELPANTALTVLGLAPQLAPVGTKVRVLTKANNSTSSEADSYAGTVQHSSPNGITVRLDQSLDAFSSSGSPVVNEKNELVGMLVGTGDDARTIINLAPSTGIYQRLYAEMGAK
jgi:hypothetical protein